MSRLHVFADEAGCLEFSRKQKRGWEYSIARPYKGRFWAYSQSNMKKMERAGEIQHTSTGMPNFKRYLDKQPGVPLQNDWQDIRPAPRSEAMGYGFQQWAVDELGCQFWREGKKGADGGVDGEMWFYSGPEKTGRLLVQVKGGKNVGVGMVREFADAMKENDGDMGVFFCRGTPTSDMISAAAGKGFYNIGSTRFPKLQVFSLDQWFAGQRPKLPTPIVLNVPKDKSRGGSKRVKRPDPRQPQFFLTMQNGLPSIPEGQVLNPAALAEDSLRDAGKAA